LFIKFVEYVKCSLKAIFSLNNESSLCNIANVLPVTYAIFDWLKLSKNYLDIKHLN